jgi:hypothetical protein
MSKQKGRHHARPGSVDRITAGVRMIASRREFVISVSDHFAGYFNELGITVAITADARDENVIELQNDLLAFLDSFWAKEAPEFRWMVMFSDCTETMLPLVLGDGHRSSTDAIRA